MSDPRRDDIPDFTIEPGPAEFASDDYFEVHDVYGRAATVQGENSGRSSTAAMLILAAAPDLYRALEAVARDHPALAKARGEKSR